MPAEKNSKKNGIEKLRILLDEKTMKKLNPEDEKYLIALKKRLNESSNSKIVIKKIVEAPKTEEYSLKPKIVIHAKKQEIKPTPKIIIEEKPKQEEPEPIFKEVTAEKKIDDDLIEIKKVEIKYLEFLEVKPKTAKKQESTTIKEKEIEEFTELKKEDTAEEESIPYFIPVEKPEEDKDDIDLKQEETQQSIIEPETKEIVFEEEPFKSKETKIEESFETDLEKEKKKEAFKEIQNIDEKTAVILYDNGYTNIDSLKNATIRDLKKIKGIKKKKAKNIITEIQNKFKKTETEKPIVEEHDNKHFKEEIETKETEHLKATREQVQEIEKKKNLEEEKIAAFSEIKSIDKETALLLYDHGFTSIDALSIASVKDFVKIPGIRKRKAKQIKKELNEKTNQVFGYKPIETGETAQAEITDEQVQKIDENIISDKEKFSVFNEIKSIDKETALVLYDNGYTNIDSLKSITLDELVKIPGIKKRKAKRIISEIEEKIIESADLKPITVDETAEGELTKEQINDEKIVFEEEKDDNLKVELDSEKAEWAPVEEEKDFKEENLKESEEKSFEDEFAQLNKDIEKIEKFSGIQSIDEKTAVILYDNGYTNIDSLKNATIQDLKKIKGIKKKKAKNIITEIQNKFKKTETEKPIVEEHDTEFFEEEYDEDIKEVDQKVKKFKEPKIKKDEEETDFFKEEIEDVPEIKPDEKDVSVFKEIQSIDDKISGLLIENGIDTIEKLNNTSIKQLTKVKGIRKKIAKQIKKEVELRIKIKNSESEESYENIQENPYIKHEDDQIDEEWESIDSEKSIKKQKTIYGFMYNKYTLYEKELITKSGSKRLVRFFSKGEPEDAKPIDIPEGYEVDENKSGVPYLRKIKD